MTASSRDDVFIVDENEEFTEQSMNPDVHGQDLRLPLTARNTG